jgi:hypothetical protein
MRPHPSAFLLAARRISLVLYAMFDSSHCRYSVLGAFSVVVLLLLAWVITHSQRKRYYWSLFDLVVLSLNSLKPFGF